jgi:RHS repeat-associated protein
VTTTPPSHDDTNYGCSFFSRGNPTTITTYTDANTPAGPIAKHRFYDSLGNLLQADSDLCQVQRFVFSSTTQYSFPDAISCGPTSGPSVTQQWTYNAFTSLPASRTDENNQATQFSYDILNRLTQIARPDQHVINISYDDVNIKITTDIPVQGTDRRQDITSFDGLARPIRESISNNAGVVISNTSTAYDAMGNIFSVSTPYVSTATDFTITHYDALSRITAIIAPGDGSTNGTTNSYSYGDNFFTITDPTGKQIQYQLDGMGRIQAVNEPDVTNGNSLTQNTSYAYTVRDELKQVTQGSQSRIYTYDDAGRLVQVQTPESGITGYQFNQFDLIAQRTDNRGVITTYGYDGMNRLSSVSYNVGTTGVPATASLTYIYGTNSAQFNNGRLLQLVDGLGSEVYSYDALGRRTNIAKTIGTVTYNLGYGYNLANQIASITYPSGRLISYNHDSYGRLASIVATKSGVNTTYANNYTYNPDMEVTGLSYGNGVTGSFGFNSHNFQLGSLSYSNPTQTLVSLSYGYGQNGGNNGQITQIADNIQPGRSVTYSYDALKRIQSAVTVGSASFAQWGLSWTYDRYGNRNSQTVTAGSAPSQSASADVTTNHIIGYGYDANGNLTFEPSLNYSYTYDEQNHLVGFSGNGTSSFGYDGNGFRVKKVATDGTVTFYIFTQGRIIAEYLNSNPGASPGREFVYQEDGRYLLTIAGDGTLDYYHPDHLSVRLTTDAAGNDAGDRGTYPYGELWYSSGQFTRNNFSTYKLETESNTDYAEFRYYSLRAGRFMQADPISGTTDNPQSWNLFAYVVNDPVNRLDRLGLQTDCSPNDHGGLDCATGPVVEVNGSDDNGPIDPSLLGGGGAPAPFPGDNGGGGPDAAPRDPNKNPKKVTDVLKCASEFSNNHSLAALFGAQNTTLGKVLGGNTIGGIVDVGLAIGNKCARQQRHIYWRQHRSWGRAALACRAEDREAKEL